MFDKIFFKKFRDCLRLHSKFFETPLRSVKNIRGSVKMLLVKSLLLRLSSMTLLFAKQRKQLARISCKSQTSKIIRT